MNNVDLQTITVHTLVDLHSIGSTVYQQRTEGTRNTVDSNIVHTIHCIERSVIQSATLHRCVSHTDSEHFLFSFGEGGVVITVAEKLVFRPTYSGSGGNRNVNILLRQNEIAGITGP